MRGYSAASPTSVSTAFVTFELGAVTGETWTRPVPPQIDLCLLTVEITGAGAVGDWTMYLSHDPLGTEPITDYSTSGSTRAASESHSDATAHIVAWDLGALPFVFRGDGLYCHLKQTETGVQARPVLAWRGDPR